MNAPTFPELDLDDKIALLADKLTAASSVAFLTGAGISTSCGIPDFRSSTGIYRTTSEEIFSFEAFQADPARFYSFFAPFYRETLAAKPSPGHRAIAELETRCGKKVDVATQNIDALHSAAGSTNVAEIHGTLRTASCLRCEKRYPRPYFELAMRNGAVPRCECGGVLKPDVVFFGEELPPREFAAARRAMWEARLLLILGTSLQVYPAAGLPRDCDSDVPFVVINRTPTPLDRFCSLVFYDAIDEILPKAVARVPDAPRA